MQYGADVDAPADPQVVKNKIEAAYRRTDLFERRRVLMEDWASYLAGGSRQLVSGRRR